MTKFGISMSMCILTLQPPKLACYTKTLVARGSCIFRSNIEASDPALSLIL
jgi:hypothetical protein